ncbi:PKD domain-containing protein [Marinilabiliaceae bacterium JC017]|nr:PKD domain-containing protein [Marinilabiliaceae bacterium JC017]
MKKTCGLKGVLAILSLMLVLSVSCKKDDDLAAPVAAFDYDMAADIPFGIPLKVTFSNTSKDAADDATYAWDFGDGEGTSQAKDVVYTYKKGGTYTVSLTVNNAGKSNTYTEDIQLTNQMIGTWVLDSLAASTIDTMDVKGAMEFGNKAGWDGAKWTTVGDEGFSTFWSNVIFKGNYFGRKMLFANEFTFNAEGTFTRALKGDQYVHWAGEQTLSESVDWVATDGTSLNGYKSSEAMTWTLAANQANENTSLLTISDSETVVPWLGMYFAGNENMVSEQCQYVVSVVNKNQLIVSGTSNLFPPDNVFVLKFKRVE